MNRNLNRRDFAKRTSAAVGSLLAGEMLGGGLAAGQDRDMPDQRLVLLGLNALARAHGISVGQEGRHFAGVKSATCPVAG